MTKTAAALLLVVTGCGAKVGDAQDVGPPDADGATSDAATDATPDSATGTDTATGAASDTTAPGELDVVAVTDPATILSPELLAALPRSADGRPVLFDLDDGTSRVQLVWDPTQDDAVMHFGHCLAVAMPCADPDEAKAAACIHALPRCADPGGGAGCCPAACIDRFDAAIAGGAKVEAALDVSLLSDCVPGVSP